MSHTDELEEYDAELELRLKREYADVFPLFRFCVLTQEATYLCNRFERDFMPQASYPFFHITMEDVWVWDKNRPTRIIPKVEIYTTQDVTVEILKGVETPESAEPRPRDRGPTCSWRSMSATPRPRRGSTAATELLHEWRISTERAATADEIAADHDQILRLRGGSLGELDEMVVALGGPDPLGGLPEPVAEVPAPRGPGHRAGRAHGHLPGDRQPARAGGRPDRQRGRGPPAPRRPLHRRGLRHRDDLRRRLGRRRVPRRGHRPRHRDLPGRPHRPGRPPGQGRAGRPEPGDRQVDHREHALGHGLRHGRDGRRRRGADEGGARARPVVVATGGLPSLVSPLSEQIDEVTPRSSPSRGCAWCTSCNSCATRPPTGEAR